MMCVHSAMGAGSAGATLAFRCCETAGQIEFWLIGAVGRWCLTAESRWNPSIRARDESPAKYGEVLKSHSMQKRSHRVMTSNSLKSQNSPINSISPSLVDETKAPRARTRCIFCVRKSRFCIQWVTVAWERCVWNAARPQLHTEIPLHYGRADERILSRMMFCCENIYACLRDKVLPLTRHHSQALLNQFEKQTEHSNSKLLIWWNYAGLARVSTESWNARWLRLFERSRIVIAEECNQQPVDDNCGLVRWKQTPNISVSWQWAECVSISVRDYSDYRCFSNDFFHFSLLFGRLVQRPRTKSDRYSFRYVCHRRWLVNGNSGCNWVCEKATWTQGAVNTTNNIDKIHKSTFIHTRNGKQATDGYTDCLFNGCASDDSLWAI